MSKQKSSSDLALKVLVSTINDMPDDTGKAYVGITLTVNGLVISGKLISNVRWLELVRDQITEATNPGVDDDGTPLGYARLFDELARSALQGRDESKTVRAAARELPDRFQTALAQVDDTWYIHLREARVFTPSESALPAAGMFWRGKLSEVDGWTIGSLDLSQPE